MASDQGLDAAASERLEAVVTSFLAREGKRLEGGTACLEYPLMRVEEGESGRILREGVADAVVFSANGAQVLDWKTGGPGVTEAESYRQQVKAYARIIEAESRIPATGEIVPVTGSG